MKRNSKSRFDEMLADMALRTAAREEDVRTNLSPAALAIAVILFVVFLAVIAIYWWGTL